MWAPYSSNTINSPVAFISFQPGHSLTMFYCYLGVSSGFGLLNRTSEGFIHNKFNPFGMPKITLLQAILKVGMSGCIYGSLYAFGCNK